MQVLSATAELLEVEITDGDRPVFARPGGRARRDEYHRLAWVRRGSATHLIDGRRYELGAGEVAVIARGQVHCLERAEGLRGAIVRFRDEVLADPGRERTRLCWLLEPSRPRRIVVPHAERPRLGLMLDALAQETRRPADEFGPDSQRHLLATLLLWMGRWSHASGREMPPPGATQSLYGRFLAQLESDFTHRHDVQSYAQVLGVTRMALAQASQQGGGRTPKEVILDRVMLEATRLLRHTDLPVSEVSYRVGFGDPLYFSRAFKRRCGVSPLTYRAKVHAYEGESHSLLRLPA